VVSVAAVEPPEFDVQDRVSAHIPNMEALFARLAGLRMMVLSGLRGQSAASDVRFLFDRLAHDAMLLVPDQATNLEALRARAHRLIKLRDSDQRLSAARSLVDDTAALLALAYAEQDSPALAARNPHPKRLGMTWIVTGLILLVMLLGRAAYTPIFLGRYIFPNHYQRIGDLRELKTSLQSYRAKTGHYPMSADNGNSWNGLQWKGDPSDWIPGLAPTYIPRLPSDPRSLGNPYNQYVYKSDGTDYKLLSLVPEDCALAVSVDPALSDPGRNVFKQCYAYGYWTPGAVGW
jgi:hypothetical protein